MSAAAILGPRVVRDDNALASFVDAQRAASYPRTGIRRTNSGGWAAVKNGRLVESFAGVGAKRAAIIAAGTNVEVG